MNPHFQLLNTSLQYFDFSPITRNFLFGFILQNGSVYFCRIRIRISKNGWIGLNNHVKRSFLSVCFKRGIVLISNRRLLRIIAHGAILLFDLFKAFAWIGSSHKSDFFLSEKTFCSDKSTINELYLDGPGSSFFLVKGSNTDPGKFQLDPQPRRKH